MVGLEGELSGIDTDTDGLLSNSDLQGSWVVGGNISVAGNCDSSLGSVIPVAKAINSLVSILALKNETLGVVSSP